MKREVNNNIYPNKPRVTISKPPISHLLLHQPQQLLQQQQQKQPLYYYNFGDDNKETSTIKYYKDPFDQLALDDNVLEDLRGPNNSPATNSLFYLGKR